MGILATRIGGQAQDCLPSTRPRQELFSSCLASVAGPTTLRVFFKSLRRVALNQFFEFGHIPAEVPDIAAGGASKLSPTSESRQFRRSFISQAPLREKRAACVHNVHAVHRIPASTPAAYHSQELATAMPDRDDDPDGAGHSRSRSRMPDLEWLS